MPHPDLPTTFDVSCVTALVEIIKKGQIRSRSNEAVGHALRLLCWAYTLMPADTEVIGRAPLSDVEQESINNLRTVLSEPSLVGDAEPVGSIGWVIYEIIRIILILLGND